MLLLGCATCGKEFRTFPSMVKKGNGKFCSQACYGRSIARPAGPRAGAHERTCEHCGATFFVYPARIRKGEGRFCSVRCYADSKIASFPTRFWEKFDRSGPLLERYPDLGPCWLWTGAIAKKTGYGKVAVPTEHGSQHTNIHRVAWTLWRGPIPVRIKVCHHCDIKHCGSPDHLFLGTQKQNMEDMVEKGRSLTGDRNPSITHAARLVRGERHHQSKLTWTQVLEARRLHQQHGMGPTALAKLCGVTPATIWAMLKGKTWRTA